MISFNFYVSPSPWDFEVKVHPHCLFSWTWIKICNYNEAKECLDDVKSQMQSPLTFPKNVTPLCHQSRFLMSVKQKATLEGIEVARLLLILLHSIAKL
jgi:hypothetical protein